MAMKFLISGVNCGLSMAIMKSENNVKKFTITFVSFHHTDQGLTKFWGGDSLAVQWSYQQ